MGKIEAFTLRIYETEKPITEAEYAPEDHWVPLLGYVAGEWACHPQWRVPSGIRWRNLGEKPSGIFTITHIPTGRMLALTHRFFDGARAVDRLAGLPIRWDIPPGERGKMGINHLAAEWVAEMVEAVADLALWYRGREGRISLTYAYTKLLNARGRASSAGKGTNHGIQELHN